VLICSGKDYYELAAYREERRHNDVSITRLEQLYPLRAELLAEVLRPCANSTSALWVQEEPANMGAWRYLHDRFGKKLLGRFPFALVSRFESASPATGSAGAHKLEQARLIARAFGDREPDIDDVLATKKSASHPAQAESDTDQARETTEK